MATSARPAYESPHVPGPSNGRTKKKTTSKKQSNFSVHEDVALVQCWINVSIDAIVGTGQRKEAYWTKLVDQYNRQLSGYPERTQKSLINRWDYINQQVSKFAGYVVQAVQRNPSGYSDADKTAEALSLYHEFEKTKFTVAHCWDLLKNEPKWLELNDKRTNASEDGLFRDHIGQASNEVDVDANTSSPSFETAKRPAGKQAAKEARKRASSGSASGSSSEYVSQLKEMQLVKLEVTKSNAEDKKSRFGRILEIESEKATHQRAILELEKERVKIENERLLMEKKKDDKRILTIDLSQCNPAHRVYYQRLQEEILARFSC